MKVAQVKGEETVERKMIALYESALDDVEITGGTRLLDVGCGAGLFLRLAAQRGASVTGIDAATASLPYPDDWFDVVTGFNSFQFAADPAQALREAGRVAWPGAPIVIATWGRPDQCEAAAYVKAVGALLPPPPHGAPGPFALSEPGALEEFTERGALAPDDRREVHCVWTFPDRETLLRVLKSTGFAVRAIDSAGEQNVTDIVLEAVAPYRTSDGGYRLENVFTYLIATTRNGGRRGGPGKETEMASTHTTQQAEQKSFDRPDETREFSNGRAEILNIGGGEVGRLVLEPGWRWSNDVKPIAKTHSCEVPHFQYHVSGRLAIRMDDGTEIVAGPGDITSLPSGHDGWVVGDEPVVVVDWYGAGNYAKGS